MGLTYIARGRYFFFVFLLFAVALYGTQTHQRHAGTSLRRRLRRSLSCSPGHTNESRRDLGNVDFFRESKQQHRFAKRGGGTNQRKIKNRDAEIIKNVVRRLPLTTWQSATLRFSLCFRGVKGGNSASGLPGFSRLDLGPKITLGPAVLDRVSRCKAHMLVMKAHTTYYRFPSPRTWLASLKLSFYLGVSFFFPFICCGSFIGDALSRNIHAPTRLPTTITRRRASKKFTHTRVQTQWWR